MLILHASIGCDEYFESLFSTVQEVAVLKCSPALFLYRTYYTIRQVAAKLARQVFVEEDSSHAMFASSARPASSRKPTAWSRLTPG